MNSPYSNVNGGAPEGPPPQMDALLQLQKSLQGALPQQGNQIPEASFFHQIQNVDPRLVAAQVAREQQPQNLMELLQSHLDTKIQEGNKAKKIQNIFKNIQDLAKMENQETPSI